MLGLRCILPPCWNLYETLSLFFDLGQDISVNNIDSQRKHTSNVWNIFPKHLKRLYINTVVTSSLFPYILHLHTGNFMLILTPHCMFWMNSQIKLASKANTTVAHNIQHWKRISLWRHQMETFSALLALVRGIHRYKVDSPQKGQ